MMTELCGELRNYFDRNQPKITGIIEISDGKIIDDAFVSAIQNNQYFRIIGSVFNDGVHKNTEALSLTDEIFSGTIWLMAIPQAVIDLSDEIDAWIAEYGTTIISPFSSEAFGGYSYTKGSSSDGSALGWKDVFAPRLNIWRKI